MEELTSALAVLSLLPNQSNVGLASFSFSTHSPMGTGLLRISTPSGIHEIRPSTMQGDGSVAAVLASNGFPLNTRCAGRGLCSGCEIRLTSGSLLDRNGDAVHASDSNIKACTHFISDVAAAIEIPPRSLLAHAPSIVSEFKLDISWANVPLSANASYGIAIDIGTTTVALLLCDCATGKVLAEASAFNAQIRFGEDVVTRIQLCTTSPGALKTLQRTLVDETLNPLINTVCANAGITSSSIGIVAVAANTTMLHLLAGVDPTPMGVHPFEAPFLRHRVFSAFELGLKAGPETCPVHLLPSPAAYVGADLASGVVATGLLYDDGPSLLVDVGTNGEIIAKIGERIVACATAAGPAFEGAGLTSGSRGVRGAIERIRINASPFAVDFDVIGDTPAPIGICGSAYVDFLWEARKAGIILTNGRFAPDFCTAANGYIRTDSSGRRLLICNSGASGPICISEADIARLLQAKAAIAAGISTLLGLLEISAHDVKKVHLAGGFGLHLSLPHAIGCGLLPGFDPAQIEMVGNTSLGGAFLAIQDQSLLEDMCEVCSRTDVIELNLQPGFETTYIDHLSLP